MVLKGWDLLKKLLRKVIVSFDVKGSLTSDPRIF